MGTKLNLTKKLGYQISNYTKNKCTDKLFKKLHGHIRHNKHSSLNNFHFEDQFGIE